MGQKISSRFFESLKWPFLGVVILWIIHAIQHFTFLDFKTLGVYPREVFGLKGILFSPFIHSDFGHLISNSLPFFVLSAMIIFFYRKVALPAFGFIYLLTGLLVWIFARPSFHIGASGVIYGLVAFVFWNGLFRRNLKSIALALIVAFYYGGMVMGVLPLKAGVSWESHLLGGIVGVLASFWFKEIVEEDEAPKKYSWENEEENPDFFLQQDIFEKTRQEKLMEKQRQASNSWFSDHT